MVQDMKPRKLKHLLKIDMEYFGKHFFIQLLWKTWRTWYLVKESLILDVEVETGVLLLLNMVQKQ